MFRHKIKFTDFNGNPREEDFYFHLSLPEVTRLQVKLGGKSLEEYAKDLEANQDVEQMIEFLEKIVLTSYGKKTSDGLSFRKSKELREEFEYSQAYAELFEQLLTNPELTQRFAEGIVDDGKTRKNQVVPKMIAASERPSED